MFTPGNTQRHIAVRATLVSACLVVSAFAATASAAVTPSAPKATAADQNISLASPPSAIAQAAIDVFGPNGSYLQNPSLRQQAVTAYKSLPPAAQQAIVTDVLSVSTVTSSTVPVTSSTVPVTTSVASATSCGYSIIYDTSKNVLGWVLVEWSVQVNGCSNGSTVSNDSYFPNIEELSWGWGFNRYATQYGRYLSSSDYEAFVNAIFSIGEYSFGISSSQSITLDVYGNGTVSGSCMGGTTCNW